MDKINEILSHYSKEDYQIFYDTVDMLCAKGVKGNFEDYNVVVDILSILTVCENLIKNGLTQVGKDEQEK